MRSIRKAVLAFSQTPSAQTPSAQTPSVQNLFPGQASQGRQFSMVPTPSFVTPTVSYPFVIMRPLNRNRRTRNPTFQVASRRRQPSMLTLPVHAASALSTLMNNATFVRFAQASALNVPGYFLMRLTKQHVLTADGLLHALGLGILLWTTLGIGGYILCVSFLVVGSILTRVGKKRKDALGIAEKRGGARGPENLWGAAGTAAICANLIALLRTLETSFQTPALRTAKLCLTMAYCGAIAAKSADTTSSEVGKAYGSRTFLVTTFREVDKGTEGAISAEGTLAGIVAALGAATLAQLVGVLPSGRAYAIGVTTAGTFTNLMESIIGASLQTRLHLTNEQVNFVNTLIGAIYSALFCYFITILT